MLEKDFNRSATSTEATPMKKFVFLFSTLLLLPGSGFSMGRSPAGITLLLVPSRPAMVQLGMDMAQRRHAILMTYAENTSLEEAYIHLWDGEQWLRVSPERYRNGTFLRNSASKVLVVGEENDLTAGLIGQGLSWSPEVLHLGTLNVTELINQMGRLFEFDRREWDWMAKRYDLTLEDLGAHVEPQSWYDSNRASTLPPAEKPWKKTQDVSSPAPQTSLTPMMPPPAERESEERMEQDTPSGETRSSSSSGDEEPASDSSFRLELEP